MRTPTIRGASAPTSCSAIATARPARRNSPPWSRDFFRSAGYSVAVNDPYKGVEIVRKHGRPASGRHSLQIELNRRLYMDEATLLPNARYADLEADLGRLIAAVGRFVRAAIGKTT